MTIPSPFPNNLTDLHKANKVCRTLGIKFITSPEIVYLARNAGFHALFIDLEHSSLSLQTANQLCVAALNAQLSPIVRVPGQAAAGFVQRVLDNGAQGVIFPHVDTVEQAEAAVRACKYPPLGKRSVTGMMPHMGFRATSIAEVSAVGNAQLSTVVVMIESAEAVENVEAIAAVEGVDALLIGTNDLSIELGCPGEYEHARFVGCVERIAAAAAKNAKILGVAGIYNRSELMQRFIHQYGARFVLGHMDLPLVQRAAAMVAEELKQLEDEKVV